MYTCQILAPTLPVLHQPPPHRDHGLNPGSFRNSRTHPSSKNMGQGWYLANAVVPVRIRLCASMGVSEQKHISSTYSRRRWERLSLILRRRKLYRRRSERLLKEPYVSPRREVVYSYSQKTLFLDQVRSITPPFHKQI